MLWLGGMLSEQGGIPFLMEKNTAPYVKMKR